MNEPNSNGYEIDKATETPFLHSTIQGETIKYENDIYNWFADLAGKTIMVELKDPMSSSNSIKTLLSLGSTFSVYSQLGVWRCSYGGSPCDTWLTSTSNTVSIAIPNGTTITSFIIGNNSS